jgi:hypothetical protein
MQHTVFMQGQGRSDSGAILATLEIHLLFVSEAVYPVTGVSYENWGKDLR